MSLMAQDSQAWVQAGVASQLYHDRDFWYCIQYHGFASINCLDASVFDTCGTRGHGLGQSLTFQSDPITKIAEQ